jgi:predicted metalloprotease with PDZ domain
MIPSVTVGVRYRRVRLAVAVALFLGECAFSQSRVEEVHVDLSDAPKNVIHSRLRTPVKSGPTTLVYPKWLPGNHSPTGPIGNLAGLILSAAGSEIEWSRDPLDMYAFHVTIPANVTVLDVNLDFLAIASPGPLLSNATTEKLAVLRWPLVVVYPERVAARDWIVQPSVTLPPGWKFASALDGARQTGQTVHFEPVTLEKLIDSPLIAGEYFRRFAIGPEATPHHHINIVADRPEDLVTTVQQDEAFGKIIVQARALFHSYHFDHYDFLISLSDKFRSHTTIGGTEHHQSSDDPGSENIFRSPAGRVSVGENLAHEYAHSWNGKYRRPIGEFTSDYQTPVDTRLTWVYEGLTMYLGALLSVRSGATIPEDFRDSLADWAAQMDTRSGRGWRNLSDDSMAMQIPGSLNHAWGSWRRGLDYYQEGGLLWLGVDVKIRILTKNKKSLNDFCRSFFGNGADTGPDIVPYTLDQLTAALNTVVAYDWAGYLNKRVQSKSPHAPLDGITEGGWTLAYTQTPTAQMELEQKDTGSLNAMCSIGLELGDHGMIADVRWGSAADAAGLAPGMLVLDVGGKSFSAPVMRKAMKAAHETHRDLLLTVRNTGYQRTVHIACPEGEQYPHLARAAGVTDLLDEIAKPIPPFL